MYDFSIDVSGIALFQNSFILRNPLLNRRGHTDNHHLLTGVLIKLILFASQEFNINPSKMFIVSGREMT